MTCKGLQQVSEYPAYNCTSWVKVVGIYTHALLELLTSLAVVFTINDEMQVVGTEHAKRGCTRLKRQKGLPREPEVAAREQSLTPCKMLKPRQRRKVHLPSLPHCACKLEPLLKDLIGLRLQMRKSLPRQALM